MLTCLGHAKTALGFGLKKKRLNTHKHTQKKEGKKAVGSCKSPL